MLPLTDLDRGGEAETALAFHQDAAHVVRVVALLDGEDGELRFLMKNPPGHERLGFELLAAPDSNGDGIDELRITTQLSTSDKSKKYSHWTEWVVSPVDGSLLDRREHEREGNCIWLFDHEPLALDVDLDGLVDEWRWRTAEPRRALHSSRTGEQLLVPEQAEYWNLGSFDEWLQAPAGDVDADGVPDWIQGSREHDPDFSATGGPSVVEDAGCVELYSGRTGRILLSIQGARKQDGWARRVGAAGDVNRDGIDDVFIDSYRGSWVLYGRRASFWW